MKKKDLIVWTDLIGVGSFFIVTLMIVFAFHHVFVGQFVDMFGFVGVVAVAFTLMMVFTYYMLSSRENKLLRVR